MYIYLWNKDTMQCYDKNEFSMLDNYIQPIMSILTSTIITTTVTPYLIGWEHCGSNLGDFRGLILHVFDVSSHPLWQMMAYTTCSPPVYCTHMQDASWKCLTLCRMQVGNVWLLVKCTLNEGCLPFSIQTFSRLQKLLENLLLNYFFLMFSYLKYTLQKYFQYLPERLGWQKGDNEQWCLKVRQSPHEFSSKLIISMI